MKKLTFLITFLFAITAFSFADTHIPAGSVSGNWAFANSPFIIDGEISIQLGEELTIEPGVQVLFSGHYKFNIYGRLLAQGTETDTIVFTAQDTLTGWHSLRFYDTNTNGQDSSKVVYCKLEYGKASGSYPDAYGGAIYCENSSYILIKSCLITKNSTSYYDGGGGGIYCNESSPSLINVTITENSTNNSGGGICCRESSPSLTNVTITGNSSTYYGSDGGGISCYSNSNPILENVTITDNSAYEGGGIYCDESSPSLTNVTITGNSAGGDGGGIYCYESDPILTNVTITGHSALSGGGIYCRESSPSLTNVTITGNSATGTYGHGGGIFCSSNSSPILENVIITANSASSSGGGIYCNYSSPILTNVTITANSASSPGGGIYCSSSSPILENVTITDNSANSGGGICCSHSSPILENVTITDNSASFGGGGISCNYSSPSLVNVTITGNSASRFGGGICFSYSSPSFDPVNRCNIFLNYAGNGNDLTASNCPIIDVIVDTFTVLQANDYFAYPIDNFTFDILNGKIEPLNQDLYVNPNGSNNNNGLTPDEPLLTISYALAKITADNINPQTIYLSNGTYSPSQTGEIFPLNCRSYVSLQGEEENYTILDGEGISGILYCIDDNNFSVKTLTIRNGNASSGGGIYCNESSPSLENVTITLNSATTGGGIYCSYSSPSLENVTITDNSASYAGGGISCYSNSNSILENVTITGNSATGTYGGIGGGIYCDESSPSLINVTITGNSTNNDGAGIYCDESSPSLINCIMWNDTPEEVYFSEYGNPNTITIAYSDIEGGEAGIVTNNNGTVNCLEGNIDSDPLFVDPANANFHLSWANFPIPDETKSPCIDAGDPNSPFDPDGTIADMGAFYFNQSIVSQQIYLSSGFSFVSSHIIPDNPDMLVVMADVLNDNLDFARNSLGQTLRKIGPNWVNGIGDWIIDEGYLVKMNAADLFTINGTLVDPTTPIPVETGFQFVSYFPENSMDAIIAFETIIGNDLHFIRGSEGTMIRKIGPNWVNGIGDCQSGEGYLVKMFAAGEIIYPSTAKSSEKVNNVPLHFVFKAGNPAEAVYTLYIKGLEIGDEVAAYDGEKLVGAIKINSKNTFENELPVFSTLTNGIGYEEGNPITFKVWSENNIVAADFTMETIYDSYVSDVYPAGDGKYSVVYITKGTNENKDKAISIYPNPSNGIFNISIEGIIGDIQIKVFDLRGKEYSNFELSGSTSTQLDLTDLAAGVYFIRFSGKDFSEIRKIVIQ